MTKHYIKIASMLIAIFTPLSAMSQTAYSYAGKITELQLVEGTMNLRVKLDTAMTNCNLGFAFSDTTSSLYNTYVASLTTAYSMGKSITLQVNKESSGFCRISLLSY